MITSDRKHFSSTYPLSIVPAQTRVLGCMFVCVCGGGGGRGGGGGKVIRLLLLGSF